MFFGRFFLVLLITAFLAACGDDQSGGDASRDQVTLTEWVVPYPDSRPRDPFAASVDKIWFVGQRGGYLAFFNPGTEEFTQIALADGSGPHNIIADNEGNAWFAGNLNSYIGLVRANGEFVSIEMPTPEARDPHTLTEDGKGNIWFTVQGGNFVGRLNKTTFNIDLVPVPTELARPYGITVDSNGAPWVALFGTNKIATLDPETLLLKEITLPREKSRPRRIEAASDDTLWYVDYAAGYLGHYDPDDEEFEEWQMPSGSSAQPYGMAIDNKDRVWFVEVGPSPNNFVGFDLEREEFFSSTEIESGGGAVRHMMYHEPTNTIWFGTDANTLGRAELPD